MWHCHLARALPSTGEPAVSRPLKAHPRRFTNEPDKQKYYDMIDTCLTETFPDTQIPEHNYFVDFMRDAPEVPYHLPLSLF